MAQSACPAKTDLEQFVNGLLSQADADRLEKHLIGCPSCIGALRNLRPQDPLLSKLDATVPGSPSNATMIRQLRNRPCHAQHAETLVQGDSSGRDVQPASPFSFLAAAQEPDEIGRLSDYRVLKQLGAGGMGAVFLAEDTGLHRQIALKVMLPEAASKPGAAARFLREARSTAAIKHDNIITIYRVGEERGVPFLAMELLMGSSLEDWLQANPQAKWRDILRIGRDIALGLAAAHERGLIHRDIKPANIWLEAETDRVKILDFGLARQGEGGENITQSGTIIGTPAYMAPEQARGEKVDARADLFSLGCVLYRLCTGKPAFSGPSVMSVLMALGTVDPPPPSELRREIPPALNVLIRRLLSKDPAGRPASARAVADEILAIARSLVVTKPPAPVPATEQAEKPAPRPSKKEAAATVEMERSSERKASAPPSGPRRRWPLFAGIGGAVVFAATLVFLLTRGDSSQPKPPDSGKPSEPESTVFAKLDPGQIPAADRFPWQPKELVAIIGEHRQRHFGRVNSVACTADGATVVSAAADGVRVWDGRTMDQKAWVQSPNVGTVALSPDGKRLVLSREGQGSECWDLTGEAPHRLDVLDKVAWWYFIRFAPDGKTVFSRDSADNLRWWDVEANGFKERSFQLSEATKFYDYPLSPDGKWLAASVKGNTVIHLWELKGAELKHTVLSFKAMKPFVSAMVAFWPDGSKLAVTSQALENWVWDLTGPQPKQVANFDAPPVLAQPYSLILSDGKRVVNFSDDELRTFNVGTLPPSSKEPIQRIPRLPRYLETTQFAAARRQLFIGRKDGVVQAWDETDKGVARVPLRGPENSVVSALAPDGRWLLTGVGSAESPVVQLQLWNLTGETPKRVPLPEGADLGTDFPPPVFSPDGKRLAFRSGDLTVRIWNMAGDVPEKIARFPRSQVWELCHGLIFSPDGGKLGGWNEETGLHLFDISRPDADPVPFLFPKQQLHRILSWAFSRDGKTLAGSRISFGEDQRTVLFWDISGATPRPLPERPINLEREAMKFPYGQLVAGPDGHFRLFGVGNDAHLVADVSLPHRNEPIRQKPLLGNLKRAPKFLWASSDGSRIAVVDAGGRLIVYDPQTHDMSLDTQLPVSDTLSLELTPDGRGLSLRFPNGVIYLLRLPAPGKATPRPLDPEWVKRVQSLKDDEQVAALTEELVHRNPWSDAKPKATHLDGAIVSLILVTDEVSDVTPLKALAQLMTVDLRGSAAGKSRLRDFSPLKDLPLKTINGKDAAEFWKSDAPAP